MKKCPPGVFCIENTTMAIVLIALVGIFVFMYNLGGNENENKHMNSSPQPIIVEETINYRPNYPYNNLAPIPGRGVLRNPYVPPLKDERYLVPQVTASSYPINVSTAVGAVDTNYRQLGLLTPLNGRDKSNILPLMGRPLFTSRQKWQYYTISNQHNNIKLPISVKQRSALNDNGVDEVYTGDTVYVEGYDAPFKVTVYETNTIKYLPYL